MPDLSIVIITVNEERNLPLLLEDLRQQSWQDFEIIHVDSGSSDGTLTQSRKMSAQFEFYKITEIESRGLSRARNAGARDASGDRLLFLDADTRLSPTFLEQSIAELSGRDLEVGIVCMKSQGLPWRHKFGTGLATLGIHLTSAFFPTAIGACLFSEREIHDEIGGFDERLSLCEDCNYVLRASQAPLSTVGVLRPRFSVDPHRLNRGRDIRAGLAYLRANIHRYFRGELFENQIPYEFGQFR